MQLACVIKCLCLGWAHAICTEISRICKHQFLVLSKETSPILDRRTRTSYILKRRGKKLRQYLQKILEKKKEKTTIVSIDCRALCVNRRTQKFAGFFANI